MAGSLVSPFFEDRADIRTCLVTGNIAGGQGLLEEDSDDVNNLFSQILQDNWSDVVRAGSFVVIEVGKEFLNTCSTDDDVNYLWVLAILTGVQESHFFVSMTL